MADQKPFQPFRNPGGVGKSGRFYGREYLNMKKCSGQLEGFDLDAAVKSIQEGDTNITFALGEGSSTPEQRLNSLIDYLINGRIGEIYRYRRLVW